MDVMTQEQRHNNMAAIKSKNTSIEVILRHALWHKGLRYRKNVKGICGTPDICVKKYKLAIFCDGDFWHGKNYTDKEFTTNKKYWDNKIKRNKERDLEVTITLRDQGWTVLRFWEDEIRHDLDGCVEKVMAVYGKEI
jgi:DNA mismatch endonuclease (patch repair protein)